MNKFYMLAPILFLVLGGFIFIVQDEVVGIFVTQLASMALTAVVGQKISSAIKK